MWCGRLCARVAGMAGWEVEACGVRRAPQTCVLGPKPCVAHRRRPVPRERGRARARRVQFQRTRFGARGRDIHVIPRPLEVPSPAARSRATAHSCRSADGRALAGDERGRGGRAAEEGPRQVQLHHQGQRERTSERASERERNRFLGLTSQSSARIGRSCGAAVCGAGALTV